MIRSPANNKDTPQEIQKRGSQQLQNCIGQGHHQASSTILPKDLSVAVVQSTVVTITLPKGLARNVGVGTQHCDCDVIVTSSCKKKKDAGGERREEDEEEGGEGERAEKGLQGGVSWT